MAEAAHSSADGGAVIMVVKEGLDPGHRFEIDGQGAVIGRGSDCIVRLSDAAVSRHHARIERQGDKISVVDLDSRNGTFINGMRMSASELHPGDELGMGSHVLTLLDPASADEDTHAVCVLDEPEGSERTPLVALPIGEVKLTAPEETEEQDIASLQDDRRKLALLYELGRSIHTEHDMNALLERIMDWVFRVVKADRAFMMLVGKGGELVPGVVRKRKGLKDEKEITVSRTIIDRVLRDETSVLIEDAMADARFHDSHTVGLFGIRSAMCVPVRGASRVLGIIHVDRTLSESRFSRTDLELLTAVAGVAATALENAERSERMTRENRELRQELEGKWRMMGKSPPMKELATTLERVAAVDSTVLLRGESGTGKELAARTIHRLSGRRDKPFVCVNCTLLGESLLESELFGHEKGSFTGAIAKREGRFEAADDGTVFLDEIGAIGPKVQLKLLRILESQEFERVGSTRTRHVNVRIIAATNEDLETAIEKERFREDLYYRLKVIQVKLPTLAERREDIPLLAEYFVKLASQEVGRKVEGLSPEAMLLMMQYEWPGNVRELRNTVERAVVLGSSKAIEPCDLPSDIRDARAGDAGSLLLRDVERRHIQQVLGQCGWNKSRAASLLGISRTRLDRKIAAYELCKPAE